MMKKITILMIMIIDLISWVHFEIVGRVSDHISSYCCVYFVREVQVPGIFIMIFGDEINEKIGFLNRFTPLPTFVSIKSTKIKCFSISL